MPILLIEDDVSTAEALRDLLAMSGHEVVCARNGQEGLDRLRDGRGFCLILLDLMMPVMNGFEFREAQRNDPRFASIPVIVLTADGRAGQTAVMECDRVLQKPLAPPELLLAVRQYCPLPRTGEPR